MSDGEGSHITVACIFGGYKINDGNYSGLTILQKTAINIIIEERMRISKENKLIGALTL